MFTGLIETSDLDSRDYRVLRLENGLQAVLVHDLHADKAAACVDVAVGHLQDPVRLMFMSGVFVLNMSVSS